MTNNRRSWISSATNLLAAGSALTAIAQASELTATAAQQTASARKGKIRQSVMGWCFNPMDSVELAKTGKHLGLVAIEGVDAKFYPAINEWGLQGS